MNLTTTRDDLSLPVAFDFTDVDKATFFVDSFSGLLMEGRRVLAVASDIY